MQARQDHSSEAGIIEANEQLIFTPFPCHRHPASGHPLRDLPADRGLPARHPQRGADRALPAGPSRSARPSRPVRSAAPPQHLACTLTGGNRPQLERRGHKVWPPTGESSRASPPLCALYVAVKQRISIHRRMQRTGSGSAGHGFCVCVRRQRSSFSLMTSAINRRSAMR